MRDCEQCDGTGKTEVMNCHNQSNECCGGCYKDVECDECNGSGIYQHWSEIEQEFHYFISDWNITKEELQYLIKNKTK